MKSESESIAFNVHPSAFILSIILHPFRSNSFQQRIDARGSFFHGIAHEVKRGSMPQIQRKAKLLAHVWRSMAESEQRLFVFLFVALDGYVNARIAQVVSDTNFRDGDQDQSRILKFEADNLRNLFAQGFGDTLWPMHVRTACGSGGFTSDDDTCVIHKINRPLPQAVLTL